MESLPVHIAKLILRFTHHELSDQEHEELDEWINHSDDNMKVFEALTDGLEDKVFSADDLIIETDHLLDYWMVAGLIAREMEGEISSDEKIVLQNWIKASEKNKALYHRLTNKNSLQQFALWLRKLQFQERFTNRLN